MENIVEKELVNFNIPTDLKRNFISLCKLRNTNMTVTIIEFMKEFVMRESESVKKQVQDMKNIDSMINGIRREVKKNKLDNDRVDFFQS
jgi:hypothetical protein